ncbi:hypothetical protein GQ43DRAFT_428837 [Delitschia confertaspora ATCC 74209]|uniref:Zn(2)-C6 fungal-type domain-containing protein n=1 Tax=Delitschia confertaspora ATCC 74209 TaxID=1513339 RepID=A0A9P4JWN2_9PLEO|nr:hypothetical protein GQ43DRAFT_428837 [Delitschia confertaspora ATCC 74209]
MSTRSPESRPDSPDEAHGNRPTKKRKVLSCYACRNRKMKCDRVYPVCGRCAKTGRADECIYDPRLLESLNRNTNGSVESHCGNIAQFSEQPTAFNDRSSSAEHSRLISDSLDWQLRTQDRRLEVLEKKVAGLQGENNNSSSWPNRSLQAHPNAKDPPFLETPLLRGKGFNTKFYGSTSPLFLVNQFPELRQFTIHAMSLDSRIGRIRGDFKSFRNRRKAMKKENASPIQGTDDKILAIIPTRGHVEVEAKLYFDTFGDLYPVLHQPTFYQDFSLFWEKRERSSPSFAVKIVLIMACVRCLDPDYQNIFIGDSSLGREAASEWIDACDTWLNHQSRKHLTLEYFQILCLSLIAKRVNCVKMKQDWVYSGDLLRLAMSSGMHRDPESLPSGRMSVYEKEMKRRLWSTIMELELQASIDIGLQSSLCGLYFDCQLPANIEDAVYHFQSERRPAAKPIDEFTTSSYLLFSRNSLPLRIHLTTLLNDPTTELHYSDVLHYDSKIASMLSAIPSWDTPRASIPRSVLDLQLRQFLLMLHLPYAKLALSNPHYAFSFTACINAANSIISIYSDAQGQNFHIINHLRHDIFRTAVTVSQAAYHNSVFPNKVSSGTPSATHTPTAGLTTGNMNQSGRPSKGAHPPPLQVPQLPLRDFVATTLCTSAHSLLEKAISIFEQKLNRLGTGYMEYWLLAALIGVMPSVSSSVPVNYDPALNGNVTDAKNSNGNKLSNDEPNSATTHPDDLRTRGRKAIARITHLCYNVLAMQQDPNNPLAASLRNSIFMATASQSIAPSITYSAPYLPATVPNSGPAMQIHSSRSADHVHDQGTGSIGQGSGGGLQDLEAAAANFNTTSSMGMGMETVIGGVAMQDGAGNMNAFATPGFQGIGDMGLDGWNWPDFWGFDMDGDF